MDCPACEEPMVAFAVPPDLVEYLPGEAADRQAVAAVCPACLTLRPADEPDEPPAFDRFGDAFPTGEPAVPMALLVGMLDSLALHRTDVEALLARVERAGVDPLLVVGRLPATPEYDLAKRRHQLQQLL